MNMHTSHTLIKRVAINMLLFLTLFTLNDCKKAEEDVFEVNQVQVKPPNANKQKEKTAEQYVAILYTNLFQKGISVNLLVDYTEAIMSMGDKRLAHEILVSSFMNNPAVIIPSDTYMREQTDLFLDEAYHRFYVRPITEAERTYLTNYINNNPDVKAEHLYVSFALSNEYLFY